jgi:hypothetical protein
MSGAVEIGPVWELRSTEATMSKNNGNGLPLRAALKAVRHRRQLAARAASRVAATDFEGSMTVEPDEKSSDETNERKEEDDGRTA